MKPWILREQAALPGGRALSLYEHDGEFVLRVNGRELMSTRRHASELRLGELAGLIAGRPQARALVGGLGLGFTLRAALGALGPDAEVVVGELLPEVIDWNRNPAYRMANDALSDPRTTVALGDVFAIIDASAGGFDAILLDADNGTTAMMTEGNRRLYEAQGLARVQAALRPSGVVVYWSATPDPGFERVMAKAGFAVTTEIVRAYGLGGPKHTLFIGKGPPVNK